MISTRIHGALDYLVGVLLILSPRLADVTEPSLATQIPVWLGVATIFYSLLTRYELGLLKVLSFGTHLALDVGFGVLLAASPWLFGFHERVWAPHVAVGAFALLVVVASRRRPSPAVPPRGAHPAH